MIETPQGCIPMPREERARMLAHFVTIARQRPLSELKGVFTRSGERLPSLRIAVRSGDTPPQKLLDSALRYEDFPILQSYLGLFRHLLARRFQPMRRIVIETSTTIFT